MQADNAGGSVDTGRVRNALRIELASRGFEVYSDTHGIRRELYIAGENDLARALFHFDTDAADAAESIYLSSGSWVAGMPPRFAVLPARESDSPAIEMLEQMRTTPLFYEVEAGNVTFRDLDGVVGGQLRA